MCVPGQRQNHRFFPGYLRAYVEGSDTPDAELADQEIVLPSVTVGEAAPSAPT